MRLSCLGLIAALLLPICATAAEPKRVAGTETIPATGFFVLSVNVAQLWDAEQLAGLRKGLQDGKNPFVKDLKGEVGLDLADVDRVTVTMPRFPFEGGNRSLPILYITARKALEVPKIMKGISAVAAAEFRKEKPNFPEELDGKNVYVVEGKKMVVVIDDRTFAILQSSGGPEETAKFLGNLKVGKPAQEGPLADVFALAPKHTLVVGVDFAPVRKALEAAGEVPAEFKPLASMIQAERGLLTFDFGAKVSAAAQLTFFDAETAKKVEPSAKEIFEMGRALLLKGKKEKGRDAETVAVVDPILAFGEAALAKADVKLDGKVLTLSAGGEADAPLKKSLEAFPAWAATSAARMQTQNNLKQIGLAMYNYEAANGHFPQDITDKNGKAILSWRVQLLPYMEQENLWKQLDLTKPWDDAANKAFVEKMPVVFTITGRETKEKGFTYFQSFTSAMAVEGGSPFLVPGAKRTVSNITDGTSNTLMVAEGAEAVNWMKPGDLAYDPKKLPKVGKDGWMYAGFGDGHVRRMRIPKDEVLKALITIDGGEVVTIDE